MMRENRPQPRPQRNRNEYNRNANERLGLVLLEILAFIIFSYFFLVQESAEPTCTCT